MKHFQRYLGIFRDLDAYSAILTDVQLGEREESSDALLEYWKKCPDFRKKDPERKALILERVHIWVKFSFQNVFFNISRRKKSKMFPYEISFSGAFIEGSYFY